MQSYLQLLKSRPNFQLYRPTVHGVCSILKVGCYKDNRLIVAYVGVNQVKIHLE